MPKPKDWAQIIKELLACKTKKIAEHWFDAEAYRQSLQYHQPLAFARSNLKSWLGYMMGYYDDKTAARMQKLLSLSHPFLPWVGRKYTTPKLTKKAFAVGKRLGKRIATIAVVLLSCSLFAHADEFQRHEDAQDQVEATRQVANALYETQSNQGRPLHILLNGEDCHFGVLNGDDDKQKTIVTEDHKRHTLWYLNCPSDPISQ